MKRATARIRERRDGRYTVDLSWEYEHVVATRHAFSWIHAFNIAITWTGSYSAIVEH